MKYGSLASDEVYPVPPVEIARHLGFCLGNAVLCVLCAPYRDGVEDCDKALDCLRISPRHRGKRQTDRFFTPCVRRYALERHKLLAGIFSG